MSQKASSSNLEKMVSLKESTKMNDYSILITGATGFIGKKLVERLAKTGYKVTAMSRSKYPDVENVKFVADDAFDTDSLCFAMKGIETAFYLLHSMEGSKKEWAQFANRDKLQAEQFNGSSSFEVTIFVCSNIINGLTMNIESDLLLV